MQQSDPEEHARRRVQVLDAVHPRVVKCNKLARAVPHARATQCAPTANLKEGAVTARDAQVHVHPHGVALVEWHDAATGEPEESHLLAVEIEGGREPWICLLYTSPSPRDS